MQENEGHKPGNNEPGKPESPRRRTTSQPGIGRAYRQRWIAQQIKAKLLEEGHPEECAICGAKDDLRVNHDTTGLVRGLLCGRCDKGLELFEGNPELLRLDTTYLGRPPMRYVYVETIHLDFKPRRTPGSR
jgi:hypothetical protein